MNLLPLPSVTDSRITLYASRADYIARNGGDPVNNQAPPFDTTKPACEWGGPAGTFQIPLEGAPNNLTSFKFATPVIPNLIGPQNYPTPGAPAPTTMLVKYPSGTMAVDPRTLSTQADAQALAALIASATGVTLTVEETPPASAPIPFLTQGTYEYNAETRRVWELIGAVPLPAPAGATLKTVPVQFNVAALLTQQNSAGVGAPGAWNLTVSASGSVTLAWHAAPNTGQPTPGTPGAGDLGIPVQLSATQSIVLAAGGMGLMVQDTSAPSPTPASPEDATLSTILKWVEQIGAKVGASIG